MKKIRIIIVENDLDEQLFMQEGFNLTGLFEIIRFADNGDELLQLLGDSKENLPEVILSDLNMHGKNGYDILTAVKNDQALSHIPVIITSTSSIKMVIDRCKELGAYAFILKPETFIEYKTFAEKLYQLIIEDTVV